MLARAYRAVDSGPKPVLVSGSHGDPPSVFCVRPLMRKLAEHPAEQTSSQRSLGEALTVFGRDPEEEEIG